MSRREKREERREVCISFNSAKEQLLLPNKREERRREVREERIEVCTLFKSE